MAAYAFSSPAIVNALALWNSPKAAAACLGHWESRFAKGATFRE